MKKTALATLAFFAVPFVAFAAETLRGINDIVTGIGVIVANLIPILIAIALIVFFWGLVKYVWGGGKDTAKGKSIMIAGLISLFVMVSIYGIIIYAQIALNVPTNTTITIPRFPGN